MFGSGPIKRTEPLVKKVKKNTETGIHSDEEFEKSLLEVDAIEELATKDDKKEKSPSKTETEKEITRDIKKEKSPCKTESGKEIDKQKSNTSVGENKSTLLETKEHKSISLESKSKSVGKSDSSKDRTKAILEVFSSNKDKKADHISETKKTKHHEEKHEKKKLDSTLNKKEQIKLENGESTPKVEKKRDFSEFLEGNETFNDCDTPNNKKKKLNKSHNESGKFLSLMFSMVV